MKIESYDVYFRYICIPQVNPASAIVTCFLNWFKNTYKKKNSLTSFILNYLIMIYVFKVISSIFQ